MIKLSEFISNIYFSQHHPILVYYLISKSSIIGSILKSYFTRLQPIGVFIFKKINNNTFDYPVRTSVMKDTKLLHRLQNSLIMQLNNIPAFKLQLTVIN